MNRFQESMGSSFRPPDKGQCSPVWAVRPREKKNRESILSSMPHFGLGAERTSGPTPYLGGEWKQQQQRAGRRRHRAQSLLLQPQHVHEAPLARNPQSGQHLRRGDKAARLGKTSKWWARAGGRGIRCTLSALAKPGRSPHPSLGVPAPCPTPPAQ